MIKNIIILALLFIIVLLIINAKINHEIIKGYKSINNELYSQLSQQNQYLCYLDSINKRQKKDINYLKYNLLGGRFSKAH